MRYILAAARRVFGRKDGAYDPVRYWNMRLDPNTDLGKVPERVDFDANYIRANITPGDRLLELGPGVGRTFASYSPGTNVSTLEISRMYEDQLAKVAADNNLTLDQHYLDDTSKPFPFVDKQFDVGVCIQVFIHQPPEVFRHSFSELARVCRKCVISVGNHTNTPRNAPGKAPHVFRHDYITESGKNGKVMHNLLARDQVLYFTLEDDTRNLWLGEFQQNKYGRSMK